jgi:hypothetical protein
VTNERAVPVSVREAAALTIWWPASAVAAAVRAIAIAVLVLVIAVPRLSVVASRHLLKPSCRRGRAGGVICITRSPFPAATEFWEDDRLT